MTTTNETTITRYGRVTLVAGNTPTSFLVRQWSDGDCEYFLGNDLARTSDGWVSLTVNPSEVVWDKTK